LTDQGHAGYYKNWITDEKVTFTNWEYAEPNAVSGAEFECVEMFRSTGRWNDERCDRQTNFICEKPKTPVNHINTEDEGCPAGWAGYEDRCYKFEQDPQTWDVAQSRCHGKGATLARV